MVTLACKVCTINIADFLREGIKEVLVGEPGIEVVSLNSEKDDVQAVLAQLKPEVIILQKGKKGYQGITLESALDVTPGALVIIFNLGEAFVRYYYAAKAPVGNGQFLAEAIRLRHTYWPGKVLEWAKGAEGLAPG